MKIFYITMFAAVLLSGCASVNSVRDAAEASGEQRSFEVSYPGMVSVVERTLQSLGLNDVDKQAKNSRSTVFIGTNRTTFVSWGEIVRVTVSEIDATNSNVTVYWRHRFRDGIISLARNWTEEVFAGIEQRVHSDNIHVPTVLRLAHDARVANN